MHFRIRDDQHAMEALDRLSPRERRAVRHSAVRLAMGATVISICSGLSTLDPHLETLPSPVRTGLRVMSALAVTVAASSGTLALMAGGNIPIEPDHPQTE